MPHATQSQDDLVYDVLIIGAGLSGICSLHHIRNRFPNWRVKVIEAAGGAGGTWYWNRYPGARFDSESISYAFSFDQEILNTWHWKEAYSPQAETLRYIDFVCEKLDLYKDMQFNTRIKTAEWQGNDCTWLFEDESSRQYRTRFFVSCLGFLSEPTLPNIPGVDSFQGESFHTSRWPADLDIHRDFEGKRVGVVGTGATGIQTITAVSKVADIESLHVFQRTANWSAPLRNTEISEEQMREIRKRYDAIFERCSQTPACFLHQADPRKSADVSDEERLELWEKLYAEPGFGKWLGVFSDTYTDRKANQLYSDFMAQKIRTRVHDPDTAERLIPKNHGFGTRRVPLESGYFEAYNKPHVHLVDLQQANIREINAKGIMTVDGTQYNLDVLVYATGFDAITGAFRAVEWHGKHGMPLLDEEDSETRAIWAGHRPHTYLGLTVPSMPNMFMVLGPHQPFGNATRSIEHAVEVVADLLQHCDTHGYTFVEPTPQAVEEWTEHVYECSKGQLSNEVDSWMTGVNKNVGGKDVRSVARYAGSAIDFRKRCEECISAGWAGLVFR